MRGEFPRRHTLLEQHVDFGERESFRLWNAEVCPYETEYRKACPEEARFGPARLSDMLISDLR